MFKTESLCGKSGLNKERSAAPEIGLFNPHRPISGPVYLKQLYHECKVATASEIITTVTRNKKQNIGKNSAGGVKRAIQAIVQSGNS